MEMDDCFVETIYQMVDVPYLPSSKLTELWKMTIEIVDFPMKNGGLPEGMSVCWKLDDSHRSPLQSHPVEADKNKRDAAPLRLQNYLNI